MEKYKEHSSINRNRNNIKGGETFEFNPVSPLEVWNEINQLNRSKKTSGELSTDIIKSLANNCVEYFTFFVN